MAYAIFHTSAIHTIPALVVRHLGRDQGHEEDQYGRLGYASLNGPDEHWSPFVITRDAFEQVWDSAGG